MTQSPGASGRTRLIILVAILVAAAVPAVWMATRPATQASPDEGRAVVEAFLKEIREGKPAAAWTSTTAEFKSAQGKESFVRETKEDAFLKEPLDFVSMQTVSVQDQPRSEFVFRASTGPKVRALVSREEGIWKVDRWAKEKK
jgi:hypothetical protein